DGLALLPSGALRPHRHGGMADAGLRWGRGLCLLRSRRGDGGTRPPLRGNAELPAPRRDVPDGGNLAGAAPRDSAAGAGEARGLSADLTSPAASGGQLWPLLTQAWDCAHAMADGIDWPG